MYDPIPVLEKARAIITREEDWCRGARNNKAGQRCALGALDRALFVQKVNSVDRSCDLSALALATAIPADVKADDATRRDSYNGHLPWGESTPHDIARYNNTSTHAEVLAWFDRAIAIQKEHPMEKAS